MFLIKRCCSNYQSISAITKTSKPGETLGVQGWIQQIRRLKNNLFLDIHDGTITEKFQIVLPKNERTKELSVGSSIRAMGCVQVARNGNYELHADDVQLIAEGHLKDGYPFSPKQLHAPEYVREFPHLRTRISYIAAQMRVRHRAQKAIHDYMDSLGFVHVHTPIISTNDCEGAGEVFTVQPSSEKLLKEMARPDVPLEDSYFDAKVFLSVSGQMHLEAMSYGLGNTYTLSPTFRAENCKSPVHLSEFHMFEAELVFVEELSTLTSFIEQMVKDITTQVLDSSLEDVVLSQRVAQDEISKFPWLKGAWTTLTYIEALQIIQQHKSHFKTEVTPASGFSKEQELFLVAHCGTPVFLVDWPAVQKPFYMKVSREDPNIVHALDLLMPNVGELCGGSLRESDEARLRQHPQLPNGLDWYLELRKFGGFPTGGFGMGFERYLQLLTGVKNIRDVIPFPRYPHSCRM